jgi:single-stranded DNA-binding protein
MDDRKQYPSSREGGLWVKQDGGNCCSILNTQAASANRKRRPDYSGNIEVTPDMMKLLIQMAKDGKQMKIQISAWEAIPQGGGSPYLSLSSEVYYDPNSQQRQAPQYQQPAPQPVPQQAPQAQPQVAPTSSSEFLDDDIPF